MSPELQAPEGTGAARTLLAPYELTPQETLRNRILMAPMTRSMAGPGFVPTEAMAQYYARRADSGLIISEATVISRGGHGYPDTPGLYTDQQVAGWRRVTDAVHEKGGRIYAQIWHVGRVSHPHYLNGTLPVAPSPVPLTGRVPRSELEYGTPRAMERFEIEALVEVYAAAAKRAMQAGFDGVEIHGANGYLIDQFLHHHTNRRSDDYGGSPEKMIRFALEVVDSVAAEIGAEKTGLRLSPGGYTNGIEGDPQDSEVFRLLLNELSGRNLAYLHVGIFDDSTQFDYLDGRATDFLRRHYKGTLVGNGSYTPETAARAIDEGRFDLVAIGRPFIANPDPKLH